MLKILIRSLLLLILGALSYDVIQKGSFEKSGTYKFLKDNGAIEYGEIAMTEGKKAFGKTIVWAEQNIPVYYNATCVYLKPYIDLSYDLSLVLKSNVKALSHNILLYVNKNYPGFQDTVSVMLTDTMTVAKENLEFIFQNLQNYTVVAVEYANNYMK